MGTPLSSDGPALRQTPFRNPLVEKPHLLIGWKRLGSFSLIFQAVSTGRWLGPWLGWGSLCETLPFLRAQASRVFVVSVWLWTKDLREEQFALAPGVRMSVHRAGEVWGWEPSALWYQRMVTFLKTRIQKVTGIMCTSNPQRPACSLLTYLTPHCEYSMGVFTPPYK